LVAFGTSLLWKSSSFGWLGFQTRVCLQVVWRMWNVSRPNQHLPPLPSQPIVWTLWLAQHTVTGKPNYPYNTTSLASFHLSNWHQQIVASIPQVALHTPSGGAKQLRLLASLRNQLYHQTISLDICSYQKVGAMYMCCSVLGKKACILRTTP